ncbi:hypothetical protein F4778DRAFT_775634 [Xylariomycetidae sp. FL2044]|nr:hypothetical protein F4778DRAFT_775634 [Xylariomycetidae sp. FL2044]
MTGKRVASEDLEPDPLRKTMRLDEPHDGPFRACVSSLEEEVDAVKATQQNHGLDLAREITIIQEKLQAATAEVEVLRERRAEETARLEEELRAALERNRQLEAQLAKTKVETQEALASLNRARDAIDAENRGLRQNLAQAAKAVQDNRRCVGDQVGYVYWLHQYILRLWGFIHERDETIRNLQQRAALGRQVVIATLRVEIDRLRGVVVSLDNQVHNWF